MKIKEIVSMVLPNWLLPKALQKPTTKELRTQIRQSVAEGERHVSDISELCRRAKAQSCPQAEEPVHNGSH